VSFAADALAGRLVVVTGASSGIGKVAAVHFSRCGARVALVGRDLGRLGETRGLLEGEGHSVHSVDLTDADAASDAVQAIASAEGTLHGVFHSAGTSLVLPAKLTKSRHLDDVFGAGVRGAFGVARAAARKGVLADGGSLVFMSSVSSLRGRQGMAAYSAAKAAVDGMVRVLAIELAPRRIRVNSIISGAVATEMHEQFVDNMSDEIVRNYEQLHALGFGRPADIANAATFLLSDASVWVTGTNMVVDGGYTAK
jgi:NAD(P)-dependent dehydrogenase (short-subunit alcohol dehydrogenase family)